MKYFEKDPNIIQKYHNTTINKKGNRYYPFDTIKQKVEWFNRSYKHIMEKESWRISLDTNFNMSDKYVWKSKNGLYVIKVYQKEPKFSQGLTGGTSLYYWYTVNDSISKESIAKARAYGWVVDKVGIVYDFNEKHFNSVQYKITCADLGLL